MAEIAVNLAKSKAEGLAGMLFDKMVGELSLLSGVRGEIQYIIDELEIMSAFLREAEKKQTTNEAARAWVKQVKQLAYAFEDCIDEFSLHLGRPHSSGKNNLAATLRQQVRSLTSLGARHRIANQIRSIKSKIEDVSNRRLRYGINDISEGSSYDYNAAKRDPRWYMEELQRVAIDLPGDRLVGSLLDKNIPLLAWIVVLGPTREGNTAVVKKAYESPDVAGGRFHCRAWITVQHPFDIDGLLRDIISQFIDEPNRDQLPKDLVDMTTEQLIVMLQNYLEEKRYVIVFDDIRKIDAFQNLEPALPKNDLGSRIIMTTENKVVAEACRDQYHCLVQEIEDLSPEQSFDWFRTIVFDYPEYSCPPELENLSRAIIEKSGRSPLNIVVISNIMSSKLKTRQVWEKTLVSLNSEMESNPQLRTINKLLMFSCNDLPYHIHRCFLYLSKFPEGCPVGRKRIQRLWIAEGFITDRHDKTAEEVAEFYFNELASRHMILPSELNVKGDIKSFVVHHLMLNVIVCGSIEENFVSLLPKNCNNMWIPQEVIRRLSIDRKHNPTNMRLSHVRSLTLVGEGSPSLISPELQFLRVLDLEDCSSLDNSHLEVVCQLLHLKYLSVRHTQVSVLPKTVGNLWNLEILDVRRSFIRKIPAEILKLQQLCFLLLGDSKISYSAQLQKGIGKLRKLKQLTGVSIGDSKGLLMELPKLTQLRKLGVLGLQEENSKYLSQCLKEMSGSLSSLSLDGELDLLDVPFSSLPFLRSLKLHGHVHTRPDWIYPGRNLVKILLHRTEFEEDAIRELRYLPNLSQLTLEKDAYKGERLCFDATGFLSLKVLHIYAQSSFKILGFEKGAMRRLESLSMAWSDTSLEDISGIQYLENLRKIDLYRPQKTDLERVKMAVEEHPYHPRLTVNDH